eukprot:scaffold1110_cov182-Ochromonas_danica.AAC.2
MEGQNQEDVAVAKPKPVLSGTIYDVYWLGITMVIGGQIIAWREALRQGYWQMVIQTGILAVGYSCLTCSLGEMTSILPFAGGSYGFARCTLGPLFGYLVGLCESLEYIMYVSSAGASFGDLCMQLFSISDDSYKPAFFILLYAVCLPCHLVGGTPFWAVSTMLGVLGLIFVILYLLSSIPKADLYSRHNGAAFTDGNLFMEFLNVPAWFFIGIETMPLACNIIENAGTRVPYAMIGALLTLVITAFGILLVVGSLPPGAHNLTSEKHPLEPGYMENLSIGPQAVALLMLPGVVGTAYGFMFAYSRQLTAMASSGLLPKALAATHGRYQTPWVAFLVGSFLSLSLLLGCYHTVSNFASRLFDISMFGSCLVYIALFRSFVICRNRYSNMDRAFESPLDKWGAVLGSLIFCAVLVGLTGFQHNYFVSAGAFVAFLLCGLLYYIVVAQKREFFSQEEQDKFMRAYILNETSAAIAIALREVSCSGSGPRKWLPSDRPVREVRLQVVNDPFSGDQSINKALQEDNPAFTSKKLRLLSLRSCPHLNLNSPFHKL